MTRAVGLLALFAMAGCVSDMQMQLQRDVYLFVDMNNNSVTMKDADQLNATQIEDYDRAMLRADVQLDQMREAIAERNWFRFVSHRAQLLRERMQMTTALTRSHHLQPR